MRFPTSYRWSPYVVPNSPRVAQKANLSFKKKFPISVMDEANDFKYGMQLKFSKTHHQVPPEENVGMALG